MMFEVVNKIGALKKDQSIQDGLFLGLHDDNILDLIFLVIDFKCNDLQML